MIQDLTIFDYQESDGKINCKVDFAVECILTDTQMNKRTFGPGKGLRTSVASSWAVMRALDSLREPYIIFNSHLADTAATHKS